MPESYAESQALAADLRAAGSEGIVYPSCRLPGGDCVGLFYPDLASKPVHGRSLDYHWNGTQVDFYRAAAAQSTGSRRRHDRPGPFPSSFAAASGVPRFFSEWLPGGAGNICCAGLF